MVRWLFTSGLGRLFLVAWPLWAFVRWGQIQEEGGWISDLDDLEWILTGALLPPVAMLIARWVWRGFRRAPQPLPKEAAERALRFTFETGATPEDWRNLAVLSIVQAGDHGMTMDASCTAAMKVCVLARTSGAAGDAARAEIASARRKMEAKGDLGLSDQMADALRRAVTGASVPDAPRR